MSTKLRGNLILLVTAFIWGCAFVAQRSGMEYIGPLTFNGIRSLIGGFVLLLFLFIRNRTQKIHTSDDTLLKADTGKRRRDVKFTLFCGLLCGVFLFLGTTLQQMGMVYTTAGKAGFITALYIVLVPIVGIFFKKKLSGNVWFGVILALAALYLLCVGEDFHINKGDILVLFCSFAFTAHITFVDKVSQQIDGVVISCIQLFVCGFISVIGMIFLEDVKWELIFQCIIPILYAGILSSGVAYTLQIVGQKYTEPTVASMLMSLESVFALLSGLVLLHEKITLSEIFGCVMMFAAIMIAQLPAKQKA